ncbi:class I poly(R)-hydroxyalkanoic acid synthase [Loktanella sp. TSTF-M6]|uniref:Class I poly(R)-hydroxyalkanoic acid synthase n=1 Tax=Loktanella gaetbuli TaxID=2881335 RepID=A0ABS8BVH2_9RHOB|nr:class I poly(R)-hydroxyalkanoic acid synthase [Loktanella gaetbuli]MCB5199708.1 class I poly(R)-hydroxyalkanoic acid synthase [Loktanella gaetbuli]
MTTKDVGDDEAMGRNLDKLQQNLSHVDALTQRLVAAMQKGRAVPPALQGPTPELYAKAMGAYWSEMINDPAKLIEHQMSFWSKSVTHFVEAQKKLSEGLMQAPEDDGPDDRRFNHPLWKTNPYFNFVKRQYQHNAQAIQQAVEDITDLDPQEKKRLRFFSEQIVNLFSPTNYLATNPEALSLAVETEGESLVRGLENLVRDLEANDGDLVVTLADKDAFSVGENLATTPGEVVFRNPMFELIQYTPSTEQVFETPIVIFPPWINKFYILDLKAENSFIKWLVDQGHSVFVVSWVNPDATYAQTEMADYVNDGFLRAIQAVQEICSVPRVNAIGYCIAGTTLSLTLSILKQRGRNDVNSATLFTALTDFSDRGEVGVFLEDDFVDGIEKEAAARGILDSYYMSRTFSYLRSNDLIYGPAIKSYMMGKAPPAFDLLYWNGDSTNLPGAMATEYLRGLCQGDQFATDGFDIAGHTAHISDVDVPLCAVACETDHIAAWKSSYRGVQKMGSNDKTFILSGSGHIAGIVNPPHKNKYGHWCNPDLSLSPEDWLDGAEKRDGSWWHLWLDWLNPKSGEMVPARTHGSEKYAPICPAPGTYVTAKVDVRARNPS